MFVLKEKNQKEETSKELLKNIDQARSTKFKLFDLQQCLALDIQNFLTQWLITTYMWIFFSKELKALKLHTANFWKSSSS